MLSRLADAAIARARAIVAVLFVVCAAFGFDAATKLGPYSVDDPTTESHRTAQRIEQATGYSLLIVNRYREEIAVDGAGPAALRRTIASTGRTVLFSSVTVAAALASLLRWPC